jgi:anti-sigma factor RsiW
MQCRDVRELADSFLSEQLLVETNHELLRHLETCPDCRADIAVRRAIRDRLRAAFAQAGDQPRRNSRWNCSRSPAVSRDPETLGAAVVVGLPRAWLSPCGCLRRLAIAPGLAGA